MVKAVYGHSMAYGTIIHLWPLDHISLIINPIATIAKAIPIKGYTSIGATCTMGDVLIITLVY